MQGYYRLIPEYIATHNSLTDKEKLFYGLLTSLITKFGFCWASNKYLASLANMSERTVQRCLHSLSAQNLIIVEVEFHNDRKIWTPETWGNKENLLKAYGEVVNQQTNSIKDLIGTTNLSGGVRQTCRPNINIVYNNKEKHREAWPKSCASASNSSQESQKSPNEPKSAGNEIVQLPRKMNDKPPPTPGGEEMVEATTALLGRPFRIGSKIYLMHKDDVRYFLGFSPTIVSDAIDIACKDSWNGTKISNIPAYIFKICTNLRRQR